MRVGGRRRLRVGPHLAYRDKGVPGLIPPNAKLVFEVELLTGGSIDALRHRSSRTDRTGKARRGNSHAVGPVLLLPFTFAIPDEDAPCAESAEAATQRPSVDRRQGSLFVEVDVPEGNEINRSLEQFCFAGRRDCGDSHSPELLDLVGGDEIVRLGNFEVALQPVPLPVLLVDRKSVV